MKKRFYLDTNIWMDYFDDRSDGLKPLGEFAFQFLKECEKRNHPVLYSEFVVFELKKHYSLERVNEMFSSFAEFIELVGISKEQYSEAKKLALERKDSHKADILHAILARDNNAVLISRDKHFDCLNDIVEVQKPEEVIFD